MNQKSSKKSGYTRAILADIAKEMAKPRLAESVREAAEIAEEEASGSRLLHVRPVKSKN